MSEKTFTGSLALSKLRHTIIEQKGKNGMVKGIFIPIAANKMTEGKDNNGAVYLGIRGVIKDEADQYGNHGWVAASPNMGKKWSELSEAEKEESKAMSPIIGNVKIWGSANESSSGSGASSGSASSSTDDSDDMPF